MVLANICAPALIYLVFSITQIVIDTVKGVYNIAFIKMWVTLIFTILLNFLCNKGLGIVSWIIVFIPFILMTVIVTLLLLMFGLDPLTGRKPKIIERDRHRRHRGHRRRREESKREKNQKPRYLPTKHDHTKKGGKLGYAHRINTGYDESNISDEQKQVLTDMVQTKAKLPTDPLQNQQ